MSSSSFVDKLRTATLNGLFARAGTAALGVLASILLARLLSPEDLGYYFLFIQFLVLASLFIRMGMGRSILRIAGSAAEAGDWYVVRVALTRILSVSTIAAVAVGLICYALWPYLSQLLFGQSTGIWVLVVCTIAVFWRGLDVLGSAFFNAIGQHKRAFYLFRLPREVILCTFLAIALATGATVYLREVISAYMVASFILAVIAALLLAQFFWTHRRGTPTLTTPIPTYSGVVLLSLPMLGHSVAGELLRSVDLWSLGILADSATVGTYGVAKRFVLFYLLVANVVNFAAPPMMAALHRRGATSELQHLARVSSSAIFYLILPIACVCTVFGGEFITLIFGPEYRSGAAPLAILSIGYLLFGINASAHSVLQMTGYGGLCLKVAVAYTVLCCLATFAVVPLAGMIGVAAVAAATLAAQQFTLALLSKRRLNVLPVMYLVPPLQLAKLATRMLRGT